MTHPGTSPGERPRARASSAFFLLVLCTLGALGIFGLSACSGADAGGSKEGSSPGADSGREAARAGADGVAGSGSGRDAASSRAPGASPPSSGDNADRAGRAATSPVEFASRTGPKALALIIAISDYGSPPAGMKNYRGQDVLAYRSLNAANDVPFIRGALEQHGFLPSDIYELRDSDATRAGILAALEALVQAAGEGDAVVVHYSGHGHQITDDHGPEDELDGYDELWVPYGAPAEFVEGYAGEYHIRDDTVGYYVERLRERVGTEGNVTVFLDACYSGTGTRSGAELPVRGGLGPIGPPHPAVAEGTAGGSGAPGTRGAMAPGTRGAPSQGIGFSLRGASSAGGASGDRAGGEGGSGEVARAGSPGLAPFVVISAARHDEVAHETYAQDGETVMGSLSYALAQALPRLRAGDSYNTLFTYVTSALNGRVRQTPQIEGDRDAMVFRSDFVRSTAPTVGVGRILETEDGAEPGRVELDHGGLVGLNPASFVSFFPPTGDPERIEPWTRGSIISATPTRAVVALDSPAPDGVDLLESRVFAERLAYGEQRVRVALDPSLPAATGDSIRDRLADAGMVEWVAADRGPEVVVGIDVVQGHLPREERKAEFGAWEGQLAAVATNESAPLSRPGASASVLTRRIEDWARNQYLRRLQLDNPALEVDFELAVVEFLGGDACSAPNWETAADHPGFEGGGRWTLPADTDYVLRVRNRSDVALHFAVIDLMPPGDTVTLVKGLYPESGESAGATELPAGQALQIPASCFYTEPTHGSETLKLFVSEDPIPIDQLLGMRTRSSTRRGNVPMTATREIHLRVTEARDGG